MVQFDIRKLPGFSWFKLETVDNVLTPTFYFYEGKVAVVYGEWEKLNHIVVSGFYVNGEQVEGVSGLKEFFKINGFNTGE